MNKQNTSLGFDPSASRAHVLLIYRDGDHERLARKYLGAAARSLGLNRPDISEWKFEMLDRCGMDKIAAGEAREANAIVIATTCGDDLPERFKGFVEQWCSRPRHLCVTLVVLLTECVGCSEAHWPDFAFVEAQANRCGMKLLVYASGVSSEDWDAFHLPAARRVTRDGLFTVDAFAGDRGLEEELAAVLA